MIWIWIWIWILILNLDVDVDRSCQSTQKWVCGRLKEQESISDDHLRASGPWLARGADPLRSTPRI